MDKNTFTPPTPEQRVSILAEYGKECEEMVREDKCYQMTSLSRSRRWGLEKAGAFPKRRHLGRNSCSWLLSDVLWWIHNPPEIDGIANPRERTKAKKIKEAQQANK
ncbi:TPA: helix-turn-helix transcriptional regulator [Salmonella enterica subsp. enterica serovar Reading]|nr:AlpA family phage regulatory protein [Salmonella enterica]EKB8075522.1 AlpA family phage regulatory protein [Salmonella enterica]EKB8095204.1 AlpA family phage regulatory protein [Salmonella enterica]EKE0306537.1 AlpA family phage regulatory protein [Salmonella enterica]